MNKKEKHIYECAIAIASMIYKDMTEEERKEVSKEDLCIFVYMTLSEDDRLSMLIDFVGEFAETVGAEKAADLMAEPVRVYLTALATENTPSKQAFMS